MNAILLTLLVLDAPEGAPPSVPPCIAEIVAHSQREAYAEMLLAANRCEEATHHPRTQYYAGIAHLGLQHYAQAILRFRRYLGESAAEPSRLRDVADARLAQAMQAAGSVTLVITPPVDPSGVRVEVQPEATSSFAVGLEQLEAGDDGARLWLDPGSQRIEVRGKGTSVVRKIFVSAGENTSLEIALAPKPQPKPVAPTYTRPVFPRRPWFSAISVASGASVVAGVALIPIGQLQLRGVANYSPAVCEPGPELNTCRDSLARAANLRGLGAATLGAGLGVLVGGVTALVSTQTARTRAWWGEFGGGLALSLTGAVLLGVSHGRFNRANTDASENALLWEDTRYDRTLSYSAGGYAAGAGLLGAGVGLVASAAAGLLVQRYGKTRYARRWQLQPHGVVVKF